MPALVGDVITNREKSEIAFGKGGYHIVRLVSYHRFCKSCGMVWICNGGNQPLASSPVGCMHSLGELSSCATLLLRTPTHKDRVKMTHHDRPGLVPQGISNLDDSSVGLRARLLALDPLHE